jgi:ABC-type microcin C transport system duplicated ATPase subunit YejF
VSIQVSDVSVWFEEKKVLKHITVTLPDRGSIALHSPSGTGKTTFLRVLAGLTRPTVGQVTGLGGKRVTMVFQEDRLLPWYTAYENVLFALPDDMENRERTALDWLERMELSDAVRQYPAALSGGMKRRVAIARRLPTAGMCCCSTSRSTALTTRFAYAWPRISGCRAAYRAGHARSGRGCAAWRTDDGAFANQPLSSKLIKNGRTPQKGTGRSCCAYNYQSAICSILQ